MAKAKGEPTLLSSMLSANFYKPNHGQRVRQATAIFLAAGLVAGCLRMKATILSESSSNLAFGLPAGLIVLGLWFCFRLVNWPTFANFLIDVEHEMEKVTWATWDYLKRATAVVLSTMFVLGAYLLLCDIFWQQLFGFIGFLNLKALGQ